MKRERRPHHDAAKDMRLLLLVLSAFAIGEGHGRDGRRTVFVRQLRWARANLKKRALLPIERMALVSVL